MMMNEKRLLDLMVKKPYPFNDRIISIYDPLIGLYYLKEYEYELIWGG